MNDFKETDLQVLEEYVAQQVADETEAAKGLLTAAVWLQATAMTLTRTMNTLTTPSVQITVEASYLVSMIKELKNLQLLEGNKYKFSDGLVKTHRHFIGSLCKLIKMPDDFVKTEPFKDKMDAKWVSNNIRDVFDCYPCPDIILEPTIRYITLSLLCVSTVLELCQRFVIETKFQYHTSTPLEISPV